MIKSATSRFLTFAEFYVIFLLGKTAGISIVVRYLRNPNPHVTIRLLRSFGATIGEGTTLKRSLFIDNSYEDENSTGDFRHLSIGDYCYIGDGVYIDLANEVVLKDNVVVSGQVAILTHADCNRSEFLAEKFPRECQPVKVNSDVWLGFRATILAGVTIGQRSVIATNALLSENADSLSVYAGLPARKTKSLGDEIT